MSEGVSVDEIKQADARTWKLLNRLHSAESQIAKSLKATNISKAQAAGEPAKKVAGKTVPPSGPDDRPEPASGVVAAKPRSPRSGALRPNPFSSPRLTETTHG